MSEGIFRSDKFPRQVGVFASLRQVPSLEGMPYWTSFRSEWQPDPVSELSQGANS